MNIITLTLEEWMEQHPSLYWRSELPGDKQARDLALNLYYKVSGMKSIRHTNLNEKWEVPFHRSIEYTVKYAPKALLDKPYYLMEVLHQLHKNDMGDHPKYTWQLIEQHLIYQLNWRLTKADLDYRYYDPTSRKSHQFNIAGGENG